MLRKYFINLIVLILFSISLSCSNRDQNKYHVSYIEEVIDGRSILQRLDLLFNELSNIEFGKTSSVQSAASINNAIKETIGKITTHAILTEIGTYYSFREHDFVFALSNDEKLATFSWDTRISGEMLNIKSIVLYTSKKKVIPLTLESTSIFYDDIFKIETLKNDPIYLFHGWDESSKLRCSYRIDAYTIHKDKIVESYIFPMDKSSLTSFCAIENIDFKPQMDITIEKDGALIVKPEIWISGIVYKPMVFDGTQYNYELLDTKIEFKKKDFDRGTDFNFLKGSELPKTVMKEGESDTYIFKGGLQIINNHKNGTSKIFVSKDKQSWKQHYESSGRIIGKYKNHLFFTEGGAPENWLLTIYDLSQEKTILSKNVAKAFIKKDRLLYAEFSKSKENFPPENINCDFDFVNPYGYYTFYNLYYFGQKPIVLPITQFLCGSTS